MAGNPLVKETRTPPGRRKNGKVTFRVTIGFIGHKCGTHFGPGKKPHSFGQFGIRRWQSMNGGPVSLRSLFLNNVFFVSLTRVNRLNINFGIASKLEGHGDGPRSSCMNCVGLGPVTTIVSIGNKHSLGKGSLRDMARRLKFGIFLEALLFGPFGLNAMTKCSTKPMA